ncbi:AAA family ATPase [Nonomuraea dietziae]|uniref:AAA family ATPase n=1 Tax=Nonomuraea dietziae TaxID=65515 RepID=UPI0033F8315D
MLVVLVNGLPGSGKTTLAGALATDLGLPLFSKDRIKETLADTLGLTPPDGLTARQWSQKLGAAAGETLWALLSDASHGAVLESPWLAHLRPVVAAGLRRAGAHRVHEVWCEVPVHIARTRYESRAGSRHPVHDDLQVDDRQWLEWERHAEPLGLGITYLVDTTHGMDAGELASRIRRAP